MSSDAVSYPPKKKDVAIKRKWQENEQNTQLQQQRSHGNQNGKTRQPGDQQPSATSSQSNTPQMANGLTIQWPSDIYPLDVFKTSDKILAILFHAKYCLENEIEVSCCPIPLCGLYRMVLLHASMCRDGNKCSFEHTRGLRCEQLNTGKSARRFPAMFVISAET